MCTGFASCMDGDWDEPDNAEPPYGNSYIRETNVITIQELKEKFKKEVTTDYTYAKVTENLQIKAFVTGNDIEGNLYNEIAVQDETGALIIAISQGGLNGFLPVGTELLIDLRDLYVGNYGKQPEIGTPYTNKSGNSYVSRMNRMLWQEHFTYTGRKQAMEPEVFADGGKATTWNLDRDAGKLGVLKNVSFRDIKSSSVYADPNGKSSVSWYFKEYSGKSLMIYTSPYCDFAGKTLPQGKCNVTGIFKRFRDSWEIIIRSIDDVEEIN